MGYTTYFDGEFKVDRRLDDDTYDLLMGLNQTRRMARQVAPKYGVEGEFYVEGPGLRGQATDSTVLDCNKPPSTQPGLWNHWQPQMDRQTIKWDGGEKFYEYVEWIKYLINAILKPRGYVLNGEVYWSGEDESDRGMIVVRNNVVYTRDGELVYGPESPA